MKGEEKEKGLLWMDDNQASTENEKNDYKEADEKQNRS